MSDDLIVIGGGLAGSEAAWQAAKRGVKVRLYEMRPVAMTEAHRTSSLAELVCSNSLRSNDLYSAPGLLKKELSMAGSLIMEAAAASAVPAGSALAVDRQRFADFVTAKIADHPHITLVREEVSELPDSVAVIATGPLTSGAMARSLVERIGSDALFFYDAIAPIIDADSIDYGKVFRASRYGKGGDDYLNCPMTKEEYEGFYHAIMTADKVNPRGFEESKVFEGCMPIEVMASRGSDTMRFGPMKPVGLQDPRTGKVPYAVVQLRSENREKSAYNMVGFQTRLKWPEQERVFRMIRGLDEAVFLRFGSIHRNTFINAPLFLTPELTLRMSRDLFIAGQITGVEGYIESTAMGMVAGLNALFRLKGKDPVPVPSTTAHGALIRHITESESRRFQPSNINFGLFSMPEEGRKIKDRQEKKMILVERAIKDWDIYVKEVNKA